MPLGQSIMICMVTISQLDCLASLKTGGMTENSSTPQRLMEKTHLEKETLKIWCTLSQTDLPMLHDFDLRTCQFYVQRGDCSRVILPIYLKISSCNYTDIFEDIEAFYLWNFTFFLPCLQNKRVWLSLKCYTCISLFWQSTLNYISLV